MHSTRRSARLVYRFLVTPQGALNGETGLNALLLWAGAFGVWLHALLPYFTTPGLQVAAR